MYGYSTATVQLGDLHEMWAQTVVESMWHNMSLCIISPVSRDEACIYLHQTQQSVIHWSNVCLAILNVNTLQMHLYNIGFERVMFLHSAMCLFTCLDMRLTTASQNYCLQCTWRLFCFIIGWPTLTSSGPQHAIFESISSIEKCLKAWGHYL